MTTTPSPDQADASIANDDLWADPDWSVVRPCCQAIGAHTRECSEFSAVVAGFNSHPRCAAITDNGSGCQRHAQWRLNIHGCELVLLCSPHLQVRQRKALTTMGPYWDRCGGAWANLDAAYSVVPL